MKVLIIDDDMLVAESLKTILQADDEISVIGTGHSGKEAVELYSTLTPDILLMDIRMKDMTGLEASELILKKDIDAKILFLTTFSDDEYIIKALKIGAKGYIIKQNFENIVPSIKAVYIGENVFGDNIVSKIPELIKKEAKVDFTKYDITEREMEIISTLAEGLSNKEIAEKLYLSEGTIRNRLTVILDKLNLRNRTELAIFYYKNR
ncbi:MAG: response regulator [Halanaerobiaceae bacterium]